MIPATVKRFSSLTAALVGTADLLTVAVPGGTLMGCPGSAGAPAHDVGADWGRFEVVCSHWSGTFSQY